MKRAIATLAGAVLAAGCTPTPADKAAEAAEAAGDWARPPMIQRVGRSGVELLVTGAAEPGARVVLRNDAGAAYAASADDRGRFEIHVAPTTEHLLLRPETQVGQDAAQSPDRLLILAGGRGPIAVLRFGGGARRLDAAPALGAIDSDGRMRVATGQAAPGVAQVSVVTGGQTVEVAPASDGRWSLMLPHTAAADPIRVGGEGFVWPGDPAGADTLVVERAGNGWRVGWSGPAGGRQSTWLPVAAGG